MTNINQKNLKEDLLRK